MIVRAKDERAQVYKADPVSNKEGRKEDKLAMEGVKRVPLSQ